MSRKRHTTTHPVTSQREEVINSAVDMSQHFEPGLLSPNQSCDQSYSPPNSSLTMKSVLKTIVYFCFVKNSARALS